jgi:hypothetical protein
MPLKNDTYFTNNLLLNLQDALMWIRLVAPLLEVVETTCVGTLSSANSEFCTASNNQILYIFVRNFLSFIELGSFVPLLV